MNRPQTTPLPEISEAISMLRQTFETGRSRSLDWRRQQLSALVKMLTDNEALVFTALKSDLGKPATEAFASEISFVVAEAQRALKQLGRWSRPRPVAAGLVNQPGRANIAPEPLGVVLIMAPWNYPVMLTLIPLVGALAAGNCALLKPSELAPATSDILAKMTKKYLDADAVRVVEGGVEVAETLLAEKFDHIFFTGSGPIGQVVMRAASAHLTPVTLELGGKSPCILAADADIKIAARRIAWGKCLNAGQTCVAPDYILAEPGTSAPFIREFARSVRKFYGENVQSSPDYPRIVSDRHFARLQAMLQDGEIAHGGATDANDRFVTPTILQNLPEDAPAMVEEIFGPILPIVEVPDIAAAIAHINARPKPLSLYLFSKSTDTKQQVIGRTSSGSVCINDVVMQLTAPGVPFGGVGTSGMGTYQGRASFDTFSHLKPVLQKSFWGEVPLRYPPYSARKLWWLRKFL